MAIFNLGSINADMTYRVPHRWGPGEALAARSVDRGLGGKGANMSVAAARAAARTIHIGAVGPDGGWAVERLMEYGVDTRHIVTCPSPTGHAIIAVDDAGENQILLCPGANHALGPLHLAAARRHLDAMAVLIEKVRPWKPRAGATIATTEPEPAPQQPGKRTGFRPWVTGVGLIMVVIATGLGGYYGQHVEFEFDLNEIDAQPDPLTAEEMASNRPAAVDRAAAIPPAAIKPITQPGRLAISGLASTRMSLLTVSSLPAHPRASAVSSNEGTAL